MGKKDGRNEELASEDGAGEGDEVEEVEDGFVGVGLALTGRSMWSVGLAARSDV